MEEINIVEQFELMRKMANGEIPTGVEAIASKTYYTADGENSATAEISVVRDVDAAGKIGEIVNGGAIVTTAGGIVYQADSYRDAQQMAQQLVEHWDKKDWDWQPKKPVY